VLLEVLLSLVERFEDCIRDLVNEVKTLETAYVRNSLFCALRIRFVLARKLGYTAKHLLVFIQSMELSDEHRFDLPVLVAS
jgi:hypothetical protein